MVPPPPRQRPKRRLASRRRQRSPGQSWRGFWQALDRPTQRRILRRAAQNQLPRYATEAGFHLALGVFAATLAAIAAPPGLRAIAPFGGATLLAEWPGLRDGLTASQPGPFTLPLSVLVMGGAIVNGVRLIVQGLGAIHAATQPQPAGFWRTQGAILGLSLSVPPLLLLACSLLLAGDWLSSPLLSLQGSWRLLWAIIRWPLGLGTVTVAWVLLYRLSPQQRLPGQPTLAGAAIAAVGWAGLGLLLRLSIQAIGQHHWLYGLTAGLVGGLLWSYLGTLLVLLGEQLNVTVGERWAQGRSRPYPPLPVSPPPFEDFTIRRRPQRPPD